MTSGLVSILVVSVEISLTGVNVREHTGPRYTYNYLLFVQRKTNLSLLFVSAHYTLILGVYLLFVGIIKSLKIADASVMPIPVMCNVASSGNISLLR